MFLAIIYFPTYSEPYRIDFCMEFFEYSCKIIIGKGIEPYAPNNWNWNTEWLKSYSNTFLWMTLWWNELCLLAIENLI